MSKMPHSDRGRPIEPCYMMIGAKIAMLRNTLGWSQAELAKKVGLTRTSIVQIESGKQRFAFHTIEKFATAFNTSPKHLLRGIWF
jgi:DNA-binding XRE family transcriptional regulator